MLCSLLFELVEKLGRGERLCRGKCCRRGGGNRRRSHQRCVRRRDGLLRFVDRCSLTAFSYHIRWSGCRIFPSLTTTPCYLVCCPVNPYAFAARDFWRRGGANDEHIRMDLGGVSNEVCAKKNCRPQGCARFGLWLRCCVDHSPLWGCSLLAPRHRPNLAQQKHTDLRDSTLV